MLLAAVAEGGLRWSRVAARLCARTDHQAKSRWNQLCAETIRPAGRAEAVDTEEPEIPWPTLAEAKCPPLADDLAGFFAITPAA
jgi:hypothetical protein